MTTLVSDTDNKDLIWDLSTFNRRQRAVDFVKYFENKLCVYSGSVEQLYTNYNIFFPEDENRNMVILPAPHAYHDTFQGVPADAVKVTGLNIIPGEMLGSKGLYITLPIKGTDKRSKPLPIQMGFKIIRQRFPADRPFLPILVKGDLREIEQNTPTLHLHCILLDKLASRSMLERDSIKKAITEKLVQIR